MMNYGYPSYGYQGYPNYPTYQPLLTAQQRLQQYEQINPQPTQPQQNAQGLPAVSVSSIDEARVYIVDPLGTPTLFYNAGKNEVYVKRQNKQTAEVEFYHFERASEPENDIKDEKGINTYEENFKALNDKIDGLYSLLEPKPKKAVKNDE